jgi:xanthine dehydrogenase YagS FAD-binding subunit
MRNFTYTRAANVPEAMARYGAASGSDYVAGGTTLLDLAKLEVMKPAHLVDINRVGLTDIQFLADGSLRVGALVRNSDLAHHSDVRAKYPVLAEAILSGATGQIRNMATTSGNLMQRTRCPYYRDAISACNKRSPGTGCSALEGYNRIHAVLGGSDACIATHPSDMAVALAALDAEVLVQGEGGERRVPVVNFHLLPERTPHKEFLMAPGEVITAVVVPPPLAGARSWYLKTRDRESFEFALASAAVVCVPDGDRIREARVALGGVATKPWRSHEAEAALLGAAATEESFRRAAEAALKDAQPHKDNAFKIELAKRVIVRALTQVAAGQPPVRTT